MIDCKCSSPHPTPPALHILKSPVPSLLVIISRFSTFMISQEPRGALPFRIGREACPIFSGPKISSRPIFLNLVFCLFKFILLGSHLAKNLSFWINLAHKKEELNEKILNRRFSTSFCLPYRNVEHWKISNLYFWVSFVKDYIFGSNRQKLGHASHLSQLALAPWAQEV